MPSFHTERVSHFRVGGVRHPGPKRRSAYGIQYYLLLFAASLLLFEIYLQVSSIWRWGVNSDSTIASSASAVNRALHAIDQKFLPNHHAKRADDFSVEIFSAPKPFVGANKEANLRAIRSWKRLVPTPRITLLGYDIGYDEVAEDYGVHIRRDVDKTFLGVPLFNSMFHVANASNATVAVIINGDIMLLQDFMKAITRVLMNFADFLVVSARYDLETVLPEAKEQSSHSDSYLRSYVLQHGVLHTYGGMDLWAWNVNGPRLFDGEMPHFIFGRGKYDNWITHETIAAGRRHVVDASEAIMGIHIRHNYDLVSQNGRSLLTAPTDRFWSVGKKAKFELFINIHLSLHTGSYRNQMGSLLFAPWRLARCLEPEETCFVRRLRPGVCNCEYSSSSITTQTDPVTTEQSRVIRCGVISTESKEIYRIPLQGENDAKEPAVFGMPLTLESLSQKVAINNTLVISALNFGYRGFMMNWVCNLRYLNVTNYVVAALDHKLYEYGYVRGVPVYMESKALKGHNTSLDDASYGTPSFKELTKLKSQVVIRVLKLGYNVVWSDADIVWFRNPLSDLWGYDADLVMQTNAPDGEDANAIRRINSGFYLAKANAKVISAFEDVIQFASHSRMSEQPCFYDVICGKSGQLREGSNRCIYHGMTLLLLDRDLYPNGRTNGIWDAEPRQITNRFPDLRILHNNWVKGASAKQERFRRHDMVFRDTARGLCTYPDWF